MPGTFPKSERLVGRAAIDKVYSEGDEIFKYPLQIKYLEKDEGESCRFLVSVPKRLFKRAVDRNKLKRRIREAYRLNKHLIQGKKIDVACTYISKEIVNYSIIEKKLLHLLHRLK